VSEAYRVPKRRVPVKIKLAGQTPVELSLYLSKRAERHSGSEYPSDLLNGRDNFVPATDSQDRLLIVRRSAVVVLTVAAYHEERRLAEPDEQEGQVVIPVEVMLEDGTRVRGELSYWQPEGQRRLQDYLNAAEQFIPVWEGDVVHLVNRDRVVSVRQA
jgi:hypothetical protein